MSQSERIIITGGSGFVGTALAEKLSAMGHKVTILDLQAPQKNLPGVAFVKVNLLEDRVPDVVDDASVIVHLAGASIFNRWTDQYKKLLYDSRIKTAEKLVEYFRHRQKKPKLFVGASAIGIYGDRGEELLDETARNGYDFLAKLCVDWEQAINKAQELNMRTASVRTGIVLGRGGGMLGALMPIFKLGLGGKIGDGHQWFSFIALSDLVNVYIRIIIDETLQGPINAVAPEPVRNVDLVRSLGKVLHRPILISIPSSVLRFVLGEFANAILSSQRVVPKKLYDIGFIYTAPTIEKALE